MLQPHQWFIDLLEHNIVMVLTFQFLIENKLAENNLLFFNECSKDLIFNQVEVLKKFYLESFSSQIQ